MKMLLLKGLALLWTAAANAQAASSQDAPHIGVSGMTLTRCPYGRLHGNCLAVEKPEVVYPAKPHKPPGYAKEHGDFVVQWECDHLLEWEKEDDEPKNLTFTLGPYIWKKLIRSERALNFTFWDIALNMTHSNGTKPPDDDGRTILGSALMSAIQNSIEFTVPDPRGNWTLGVGIESFYPMRAPLYWYVTGGRVEEKSRAEKTLNKKWRIGVGVGVGVGVPLLMLASFFLGKRKGKKKQQQVPATKQTVIEMN
ncbi:hypothetical protein PWT90_05944 [Aphanocladium album]|nr:hypothetical protein PWT90_05944 [Aphanocladium album]